MKKIILLLSIFLANDLYSQSLDDTFYYINFEYQPLFNHLNLDSTINHNGLWQIGRPNKNTFTSALSIPNSIITDTINPYPVNDTSAFEILNQASQLGGYYFGGFVVFSGYYKNDSDSLTDYGTIEFSPDNGNTWIDLINDTIYSNYYLWDTPEPTLTGNSNGWQEFTVELGALGPLFNIQISDTVRFRITFISDSVQTNKDGLMFDDLHFEDWTEGITEIRNDNLIDVFPNPTADILFIEQKIKTENATIKVLDNKGRLVFDNIDLNIKSIDIRNLNNGIYFLKYSDGKNISMKRFIVQH